MENKIKEKLSLFIKNDKKRIKVIAAIGIIAMLLILLSEMVPDTSQKKSDDSTSNLNSSSYTEQLEMRLEELISSMDGVGECAVMITLENSSENVYAKNREGKSDERSTGEKEEYVFYKSSGDETPVLIKEYMPRVQGVTVLCSGGDDIVVKEKIINSVTALFNISANRVSVSKIKA